MKIVMRGYEEGVMKRSSQQQWSKIHRNHARSFRNMVMERNNK